MIVLKKVRHYSLENPYGVGYSDEKDEYVALSILLKSRKEENTV